MKCMRFEFPIFRWCIHRWKNHLTWNGKWALIAWFLSVPGLIAVDTALPTVCFALAAVLLLAAVLSYRGRPQLELRWVADEICSQDGRSELVIYAKNATNRSLRELELALVNVRFMCVVCLLIMGMPLVRVRAVPMVFMPRSGMVVVRVFEVCVVMVGVFAIARQTIPCRSNTVVLLYDDDRAARH